MSTERTTRAQLDGIASAVAQATGHPYVSWASRQHFYDFPEGSWVLDYAPAYGGWTIAERSGAGESRPIGDRRRSLSELWDVLYVALRLLPERKS